MQQGVQRRVHRDDGELARREEDEERAVVRAVGARQAGCETGVAMSAAS